MPQPHSRPAIILVAFGAFTLQAQKAFQNMEASVQKKYPAHDIYWAFTAKCTHKQPHITTNSLQSILSTLQEQGVQSIVVQPIHLIAGYEYERIQQEIKEHTQHTSAHISLGLPLLHKKTCLQSLATALLSALPADCASHDAIIYVGHGTRHPENKQYIRLAHAMQKQNHLVFVGTLGKTHNKSALLQQIVECKAQKVWLLPLLVSIGNHAEKDIAGTEAPSWLSYFMQHNINCHAILRSMSEDEYCVNLWLNNLHIAMQALSR